MTYVGGSIKKSGLYEKVVAEIKNAGLELFEFSGIEPNPRVSSVNAGADIGKKEGIDVLLAVGGGSEMDCGGVISNPDGRSYENHHQICASCNGKAR